MKLELNDWEALAVEVALGEMLQKWEKETVEQPGTKNLRKLIDKLWGSKKAHNDNKVVMSYYEAKRREAESGEMV